MTTIELLKLISSMLGGLALFLSGMSLMSDSLAAMTGGVLDHLIGRMTKNKFLAFVFGAVLTALVQSASATTVLTVGLVNAGMIAFTRAIGLIIGANLGTTATAWLLSLNAIGENSLILTLIKPSFFSPFLAIGGVAMTMFCRAKKKRDIGSALLGFGTMMIGMNLMSQAVAPLKEIPAVTNLLISFSNPVVGFLFACAFAMIVQSSDAVIGIVQAFALSIGITYGMAIPLICGAQVGTCITSLISSMGGSNNGKRTALLNLYYNLLKTIPFMIVFYLLNHFLSFSFLDQSVGGIGIPVVHTFVNLCGSAVWLPLSDVIVRLARRTIPLSEEEKQEAANRLAMLDENLLATPGLALDQADKAVTLLSKTIGEAFLVSASIKEEPEVLAQVQVLTERSRRYQEQIDAYLARIASCDISRKDRAAVSLLTTCTAAFGRMGRVVERILGMLNDIAASRDLLSEEDLRDIVINGKAIEEVLQLTITGYNARTPNISRTVRCYTEEVMAIGDIVKRRYMQRVHEEGRLRRGGTLFTDLCYAQSQLIDFCDMIAEALIRFEEAREGKPRLPDESDDLLRQKVHETFQDKFDALEN